MEGRSTVSACPACAAPVPDPVLVCPSCGFDRSGGPRLLTPGTVLEGRYRIDAEVGRGGMGVVYRGTDLTLSRPVAIKAMQVSGAEAAVLARFMHEARALASVEHQNLVPAYAIGQEAGVYYIVMKFVEGRPLDDILAAGPVDEPTVRRLIVEVCAALTALHRANLVHRDIKPANIMIGHDGRVTVMDLGIVQQIGDDAHGVEAASTVGTPRYMPPEMFSGGEVDGRADLYALAVIAWHALVGRPPFDGPTPMAILYRQAHEPPPDLRQAAPHVSRELAAAIHCALHKDPAARFPDAATFAAAVNPAAARTHRRLGPGTLIALIAALLIAAALGAAIVRGVKTTRRPPPTPPSPPPARPPCPRPPPRPRAEPDAALEPDATVFDATPPDAALVFITLTLTSTPEGATVALDGTRLGQTPLTVRRPRRRRPRPPRLPQIQPPRPVHPRPPRRRRHRARPPRRAI
jgi:serine/threonine protein kinase